MSLQIWTLCLCHDLAQLEYQCCEFEGARPGVLQWQNPARREAFSALCLGQVLKRPLQHARSTVKLVVFLLPTMSYY